MLKHILMVAALALVPSVANAQFTYFYNITAPDFEGWGNTWAEAEADAEAQLEEWIWNEFWWEIMTADDWWISWSYVKHQYYDPEYDVYVCEIYSVWVTAWFLYEEDGGGGDPGGSEEDPVEDSEEEYPGDEGSAGDPI